MPSWRMRRRRWNSTQLSRRKRRESTARSSRNAITSCTGSRMIFSRIAISPTCYGGGGVMHKRLGEHEGTKIRRNTKENNQDPSSRASLCLRAFMFSSSFRECQCATSQRNAIHAVALEVMSTIAPVTRCHHRRSSDSSSYMLWRSLLLIAPSRLRAEYVFGSGGSGFTRAAWTIRTLGRRNLPLDWPAWYDSRGSDTPDNAAGGRDIP